MNPDRDAAFSPLNSNIEYSKEPHNADVSRSEASAFSRVDSHAHMKSSPTASQPVLSQPVSAASSRPTTAAIVPAYNEAGRITNVLKAIAQAHLVDEIIVVTDGCDDTTADEARGFMARLEHGDVLRADKSVCNLGMRVFELKKNMGKGGAMAYAALRTEADVLLFLDADLIGLRSAQIDDLLEPAVKRNPDERADMVLGLFGSARGGLLGILLSWVHRHWPATTGQRAVRRDVFLAVPELTSSRYGVETALSRYVALWQLRVAHTAMNDVTHPMKEEKIGVLRGVWRRMGMYNQIGGYLMVDTFQTYVSEKRRRENSRMHERFSDRS